MNSHCHFDVSSPLLLSEHPVNCFLNYKICCKVGIKISEKKNSFPKNQITTIFPEKLEIIFESKNLNKNLFFKY